MSVQFGTWNFDGKPVATANLREATTLLEKYGPDGHGAYSESHVCVLYHAFHVTKESRLEIQPFQSPTGDAVITWDGRLDNRAGLALELSQPVSDQTTDLELVASAFERWGTDCFARLVGDWALSIWRPRHQTLLLARDFVGARQLYYRVTKNDVNWCTILDPLLPADRTVSLDEEYVAGWLCHFPAAPLTPYAEIRAVPPGRFVEIQQNEVHATKYWDLRPGHSISYRSDAEYEEHFRSLFAQSVRRRLRSDAPVLAELSGGMDSSSIVCMADLQIARGFDETPRLDTVSYYSSGEPHWDELPYIKVVEKAREQAGCHIDISAHTISGYGYQSESLEPTPVSRSAGTDASRQLANLMESNGNRVLLSGFAGDEVLGGIPNPVPQLADLLATARVRSLVSQLYAWALAMRIPLVHLAAAVSRAFLPTRLSPLHSQSVPWLNPSFVARQRNAIAGYRERFSLLGPRPVFQDNLETLDALRRQMSCFAVDAFPLAERRYPYLDRDLVEFLFAIPREQLMRPGQRRSLMRRALVGIVPAEILSRRRKAFIAREPLLDIASHWSIYRGLAEDSLLESFRIIDSARLMKALEGAKAGDMIPVAKLAHTMILEMWLRHIRGWGVVRFPSTPVERKHSSPRSAKQRTKISAEALQQERR